MVAIFPGHLSSISEALLHTPFLQWPLISISEYVPQPAFPAARVLLYVCVPWPVLVLARCGCRSVMCSGQERYSPVYLEDEAARQAFARMIQGPPLLLCQTFWDPLPHPARCLRVSFQLLKLKVRFLTFLFLALSSRLRCQGAALSRLTFFRWASALTPSHGMSRPSPAGPFKLLSGGEGASAVPSPEPPLSPPLP